MRCPAKQYDGGLVGRKGTPFMLGPGLLGAVDAYADSSILGTGKQLLLMAVFTRQGASWALICAVALAFVTASDAQLRKIDAPCTACKAVAVGLVMLHSKLTFARTREHTVAPSVQSLSFASVCQCLLVHACHQMPYTDSYMCALHHRSAPSSFASATRRRGSPWTCATALMALASAMARL